MKSMLIAATAIGLGFGGAAFAQTATTDADLWANVTCSEFVAASETDQRDIIAFFEGRESEESRSSSTAAEAESNMAINSGADVSAGTRGVDQSGTAALTGEAEPGDPAGTNYEPMSAEEVVEACDGSPDTRVSEVVDRERTE